mgnify:CR=1 FL=1
MGLDVLSYSLNDAHLSYLLLYGSCTDVGNSKVVGVYTRARLVSATVAVVSILVETAAARWAV